MTVNGADLSSYEMAMRSMILSGVKRTLSVSIPSADIQEVESGGFDKVPIRVGRASVSVPVIIYKVDTTVSKQWLSEQSRGWAESMLIQCMPSMITAITRAIMSRPSSAVICIDRSSVSSSFSQTKDGSSFKISIIIGVASYPVPEDDSIVVNTEQEVVELGTIVMGNLPNEADAIMARVNESIQAMTESPEFDVVIDALSDDDVWADFLKGT